MKTAKVANSKATKRGKVREMAKTAKKSLPALDTGEIITPDNVQTIAERVATRAIKTAYAASANDFMRRLHADACADVYQRRADYKTPLSDGYDVVQECAAVLSAHIGLRLHDTARTGEVDRAGKPIDVLRATFRAAARYIARQKRRAYKYAYIIDNAAACGYVPALQYGITTAADYERVREIIRAMGLTITQRQILALRLRGLSIHAIAEKTRRHRKTVQEILRAVGKKYRATVDAEQ